MNTALIIIGLAMFIFIIVFSLKRAKEKTKAHQEAWHECPDYYTEDDGMPNKDVKIDASCITYGYTIGGDKGRKISGKFKKFFIKNLLN